MSEPFEPGTAPVIRAAANLTAICNLAEQLEDQAVNDANDRLMPGGMAMVALGPAANIEAYSNKLDAAEQRAIDYGTTPPEVYEDDDWEPPLQTLLFWSEALRRNHGQEFEPTPHRPRPTIRTEADFIRWCLDWLWDNEPHWDDFAADVRAVRLRMEALLAEGLRAKHGVPCLSVDCEGAILVRPVADRRDVRWCDGHDGVCHLPHDRCPHDRGGLRDEWKCPTCDRRYSPEDYARAVAQSAFLNADWLPLEDAMARTGAPRGSIQGWATRGVVRRRKSVETGRTKYHVGDIEARRAEQVAS